MRIILQHDIDNLKQLLLTEAEITSITPAVFKEISFKIYQKTKKQVSDSTLKRIYGFAAYSFQPSLYTLNVLAEFCGFVDWSDFYSRNERSPRFLEHSAKTIDENHLYFKAIETSRNTLQSLKNKSGIPFQFTIPRVFLNEHLDVFTQTDHPATVLTAPAGYGKTIGLCHWVEHTLNTIRKENTEDIVLFISGTVLNRLSNLDDLHQWLLALMGIPISSRLNSDNFHQHIQHHKIYLIIDGFDTTSFNQDQLDLLLNMLSDVISIYRENPNFKTIITMRSSVWINMQRELRKQNKLEDWFTGFMNDSADEINMCLLGVNEIQRIHAKIASNMQSKPLEPAVISLFNYPLFLQYYYQNNAKTFALDELNVFSTYVVIYNYIFDKVYTGKASTEKVLLIHLLVEHGKFKQGRFCIDKLKVYQEIKAFETAYLDMISIGIIREVNASNDTGYIECIEFTHDRVLSYCLAAKLVYDNNEQFDDNLVDTISLKFEDKYRLQVLKWCIYIAVKNDQFIIFDFLPRIHLMASEKAKLIMFLSKLIDTGLLTEHKEDGQMLFDITRPDLFQYFLGVEFLSPEYEQALQGLLKLKLQDSSKIWIHTCIGLIHFVALNTEKLEKSVSILKNIPKDAYSEFQINPLNCLDALYCFLRYGVVKKNVLAEITHFMFNPYSKSKQLHQLGSNYVLYILALSALCITNNPLKLLRFINILHRIHNNNDHFVPEYNFFLISSKADIYLRTGRIKEAQEIYGLLKMDYGDDHRKFTPFMKSCLEMLAANILKSTATVAQITEAIERLADNIEPTPYKLIQVNTLAFYLNAHSFDQSNQAYKVLYIKFLKIVRANGFNPKNFVFNYTKIIYNEIFTSNHSNYRQN